MVKLTPLRHRKLRSSSIVEVSVAVVISFIVFSFAISIYLNMAVLGSSYQELKAEAMLEEQLIKMQQERLFDSWVVQEEDFTISCTVHPANHHGALLRVTLEARNQNGELLASTDHLVIAKDR